MQEGVDRGPDSKGGARWKFDKNGHLTMKLAYEVACQYEVPEKSLCLARGVEDEGAKMPQFIAMVASSPSVNYRCSVLVERFK